MDGGIKKKVGILFLVIFGFCSLSFATVTFNPNSGSLGQATIGVPFTSSTTISVTSDRSDTEDTGIQAASFTSSGLPSGITASYTSIDSTHGTIIISGTPTSSATTSSTITFSIADDDGPFTTGNFSLTITLETTTSSLPDGTVGTPYSAQLSAQGGTGIYTWNLISGSLPMGLNMSSGGLISGTPTTSGTYNFTVEVTDGSQTDQLPLSILINPAPIMPISNEGQICYVENVTRNATTGEITSTGDLYVKNLSTGALTQITNFGGGCILNPQLTSDGSEILFTYSPNPGTVDFSVYLTSANSTLTDPSQGKLDFLPSVNIKYATLSPDYNETSGLLAYTYERPDRTELWVYNFGSTKDPLRQIVTQEGLEIKHPVFIDDTTIAFIGITNSIWNIYTVTADGGSLTQLTNNVPTQPPTTTPQYGRLLSSIRNPSGLTSPLLIYSKRTWAHFDYGKWDVYVMQIGGVEQNVTNTPDIDEYDPAFFGDNSTTPTLGTSGQMFYAASILADDDIWQANYDITGGDTNTSKTQRVTEQSIDFGLANWSPVPVTEVSDYVSIDQTRFVYSDGNDIYRANYDGSNSLQLTDTGDNTDPNLARNGGTIVYTNSSIPPAVINKMNHDGTGDGLFASDPLWNLKEASISPDGRWVVYAKQAGVNQWDVYAADIATGTATLIDDNGTFHYGDIESIYFNPDMTKIVYSVYGQNGGPTDASGPNDWDIVVTDVVVDNIAGTITAGTPINITNTVNSNERYSSFSNDGRKIIFVSDMWDSKDQIFTMDIDGSGVELVVANPTGADTFAYPIYGPVYDSSNNTDAIAYLMNGQIYYGYVYRNSSENPLYGPGNNPISGANPTGIMTDYKFGWGIIREKGTIVARRYLPERTAASIPFQYDIIFDVDEASVPSSFIVEEIVPDTFASTTNMPTVNIDGSVVSTPTVFDDEPSSGLTTIKIMFSLIGGDALPADHVVRITLNPTDTGSYSFTGEVDFLVNTPPTTFSIGGNSTINVSAPFMPVDIYDPDDNAPDSSGNRVSNGNTTEPNGIIDDYDLLYAIDCWVLDKQLQGYGPKWPSDINNWDNIILAVINIWSDDDGDGWIEQSNSGNWDSYQQVHADLGGGVQTKPGEYVFIGDTDSDGTVDCYHNDGSTNANVGGPDYAEMYWTQGEWGSL